MDFPANREYLMSTQATVTGGFSKWPGNHPGRYFLQMTFKGEIDHFTVICSVTWPLNGSEAGGDLALIKTSPFVM